MIVSNRSTRLGKCSRIQTSDFQCVVSTAKEGLHEKPSTMIAEGGPLDLPHQIRPCGKLVYSDALSLEERYSIHDVVTQMLDVAGQKGAVLYDAIQTVITDMNERGVLKQGINLR